MLKSFFAWLFGSNKKPDKPKKPVPPPPAKPIDVGGGKTKPQIPTDPNGEIRVGHLDPVVPALELTPGMAAVLRSPDEALDLAKINDATLKSIDNGLINPFMSEPKDADGEPVIGPYTSAADVFLGKGVVPVKTIILGLAKQKQDDGNAAEAGALALVANALSEAAWVKRPAMQFNIDGKPGNRIVLFKHEKYGGGIDNSDIDTLIVEAGAKNLRLIKQYVHFSADTDPSTSGASGAEKKPFDVMAMDRSEGALGWSNAQGFRIQDLLAPPIGVVGASHVGSWYSGSIGGKPVAIASDWGDETTQTCDYPGNVFAIDYQAGCRDIVPEATLAAYKHNADMWDAIATMIVPFSEGGQGADESRFQSYNYNPLECHDQASTVAVARKISKLDFASFNKDYGAFYCSEGAYAIANFGPQADTLIKKSNFGPDNALHKLIVEYQKAYDKPEYADWTNEQKRANPEIGWQHLYALGSGAGGISEKQMKNLRYYTLAETGGVLNRFGVYLDFIPEHIEGWQEYRPKNSEGLIARPLSMSTVVWATLRNYLPRDAVAKTIARDIGRAYQGAVAKGDLQLQTAIKGLTGGLEPSNPLGQLALAITCAIAASGWLITTLKNEAVKALILGTAGGTFIKIPGDDADMEQYPSPTDSPVKWAKRWEKVKLTDDYKVLSDLYDKFIATLSDPALITQAKLDKRLMELDAEACNTKVTWNVPNYVYGAVYERATLMKFVLPACWTFWAQQDIYGSPTCVRYVGTMVRDHYKKAPSA